MLVVRLLPDRVFAEKLLDLGEKIVLLIIMVRFDKLEPGLGITDKVSLVCISYMRSLEIDGVEATDNGVVQKRHVSSTSGEKIGLETRW